MNARKLFFLAPKVITASFAASTFLCGSANAETKSIANQRAPLSDRIVSDADIVGSTSNPNLVERGQLYPNTYPYTYPYTLSQNVTSVSQLSDVRSTDWAFVSLQSLVERYGVIAGYPDRTFRGKQSLSRYEFAAGLNSALDKINEIISAGLADKVSKEDLATLQKLQTEFAAELATLRGRVDALDAKTVKLEAQQFSTTTKLRGEAIFSLAAASDGSNVPVGSDRTNTVFSYRARLNLDTSFTGKDLLRTRLQASNTQNLIAPALASGNTTRLSFDTGGTANQFDLNRLYYRFPIGDNFTAYVAPIGQTEDIIDQLNPLTNDGQGTVSRFGRLSPLLRIGSGGSTNADGSTGSVAVLGFDWKISPQGNLQVAYSANNASAASAGGAGGLFGGSTVAIAQLVWKPSEALKLGIAYANSYHQTASLNSGLNQDSITGGTITGTRANTVVGSLVWDITNKITFNTWGSYVFADAVGSAGSTTFTSWATALSFKDVFNEGDLAAIIFGQPLYKNSVSGTATKGVIAANDATPYHLEALYRFRVTKNISITPAVYFVFNPNSDKTNGTATVGIIRTTFTF
ncbi:iron uptake porin [Pseudanabaena biceps]|nr:iron uptake porin [Pseudanabaena biceps]ELS34309.1 Carbohydrate-selective porin OprB [Pseudanabaena biceps PCC 7429]